MIKWRYDKKLNPNGNGYLNLLLHKERVKKSHRVHRLLVFNFEDGLTAKTRFDK